MKTHHLAASLRRDDSDKSRRRMRITYLAHYAPSGLAHVVAEVVKALDS